MSTFTLAISCLTTSSLPCHGPNIPGSYEILLFTASDFTSITGHIHNWVLILLWLHLFIPSRVISPMISSSILGTYLPGSSPFSVLCFCLFILFIQFSSVQSLSHVRLFATPWITACQASLSITNFQSSLKLTSIKSVMPSSHLILCHPLLLPPIPPSIRVFSNESTFRMRWPKYWSFSFSIIPSKGNANQNQWVFTLYLLEWLSLKWQDILART